VSKKEAVYILVGLLGAGVVWFLVIERALENGQYEDEDDCGCG
jgi:nitrogen fixation-related uncharacterized protein